MSEGMKKSIQLFFWCGLSTLFWGIMFGGYFGDVINVVSRTFFGHEVGIKALWFVPLNNPMKLLIYSMVFGLFDLYAKKLDALKLPAPDWYVYGGSDPYFHYYMMGHYMDHVVSENLTIVEPSKDSGGSGGFSGGGGGFGGGGGGSW